jgi:hypothetical protein
MLAYLRYNLPCSYLHAVVSIGLPPNGVCRGQRPLRMESTEKLGYLGWNPHCSHYKEDGLPWIEPVERLGYLGWNRYFSRPRAAASTGLPLDGAHREDGPPWMESTEKLGYLRMESEMLAYPRWKLPCSHLHALVRNECVLAIACYKKSLRNKCTHP